MAKKTTVTETEQTEGTTTESTQESTHTPESESTGAGDSAGPAGLAEAIAAALVERSGCADVEHMVDMAKVGLSLMGAIDAARQEDGPLKDWTPAEDPAEVVGDLCEVIKVLEDRLAFSAIPADAEGKRGFITLTTVRFDNLRYKPHSPIWLTRDQHAELAGRAVDAKWENGIRAGV